MVFYCDHIRHLVCVPYTIDNLHKMAAELRINRCWFHNDRYAHYDIPKQRIQEIRIKCKFVDPRIILSIVKGGSPNKKWKPDK